MQDNQIQPDDTEKQQTIAICRRRNGEYLKRKNRLLKPAQYRAVFANALKSRDGLMSVCAISNGTDIARLGLAVSRKVSTKAVQRNRLKRLIRESFRRHQNILAGLDLVIIPRAAAVNAANETITLTLDRHWSRINQRTKKQWAKSSPPS